MYRVLFLLLFLFALVAPSDSQTLTEQQRLMNGEVIVKTTATGFSCTFIVKGNAQQVWDSLADPSNWGRMFRHVLSAFPMENPQKQDYNQRGQYRKHRVIYLKGRYRGRILRMLLRGEISGYSSVSSSASKSTAGSAKVPSKASRTSSVSRRPTSSYFRGGSIVLEGPINSISGNRFVPIKEFAKVRLSMRSTTIRQGRKYFRAAQVTIQVDLDYKKLFIADRDVNLFRLDYRSSEFDRQVRIGLKALGKDFQRLGQG
ncbi:MAG: hypothetical protein D6805_01665 [Planctomycetota bacterium]|nr:MAG: hypothetical protein D6805_01665 [Planctomycetota bacterium]